MPTTPTPAPRSPRRSAKTAPTTSTTTKGTTVTATSTAPATGKSSRTTRSRAAEAITPVKVIDPEHRRALIAKAAYFRAEKRNFAPGFEAEDWLSAETEVDTLLTQGVPAVAS